MKKRILSLTLVFLLTVGMGSAAFAQAMQEPPANVSAEEIWREAPAQTSLSQSMYPAVHALVMAMTENHLEYDPENSEFLWTTLYYMLSLYGERDQRAELTDEALFFPGEGGGLMSKRRCQHWQIR